FDCPNAIADKHVVQNTTSAVRRRIQPPSAQLEMSEKGPWATSIAPASRLVQAGRQRKDNKHNEVRAGSGFGTRPSGAAVLEPLKLRIDPDTICRGVVREIAVGRGQP